MLVETETQNMTRWVGMSLAIAFASLLLIGLHNLLSVDNDNLKNPVQSEMDRAYDENIRFADDPLNHCGDPCIIEYNPGGYLLSFIFAARTVEKRASSGVIIDGGCVSGCALFADLARPHVCITQSAIFGFHNTSYETELPDSPDITDWVHANGGYPSFASQDLTLMFYDQAKSFWPTCKLTDYDLNKIIHNRGSLLHLHK